MQLFPPPARLRSRRGTLTRGSRRYCRITLPLSGYLADAIVRFCDRHDLEPTAAGPDDGVLVTLTETRLAHEHYRVTVANDGITATAGDPESIFRALTTVDAILAQHPATIPCAEIEDAPDFAVRGVMLDISRCKVPTLATLYRLIDAFAMLKLNQLQLYTEHTFAFTAHRRVWAESSPLTATDILKLSDYCASRFIELVPNLNSFGHFERWLKYPEYHDYAECPDGFTHPLTGARIATGSTLRPTRKSLDLLRGLYDEYLPLFDSEWFNIGGDEPWELGEGASRARCEAEGKTNVYIDFLSEIQKLVESRGRRMMFWSDIVLKEPASLARLSRDLTALNWGYEGNHPFRRECEHMAARRIPFYVCPGTSSWNSLTGRVANATRNLEQAARHGHAFGAAGYLVTDWGDHGHHQYLPISFPGFVAGACNAWNVRRGPAIDLAAGVAHCFVGDIEAANVLLDLGRVLELAPSPIRNATIFNRLLFWQGDSEPRETRDIDDASLRACRSAFGDLIDRVPAIPTSIDNGTFRDEIANAIGLATIAVERLQGHRRGDPGAGLRGRLAGLIGEHERLWLARNRPGGLEESAGRLRRTLHLL